MDEDLMNQILSASGMAGQQANLQRQQAIADALRGRLLAPHTYTTPGAALGGLAANIIGGVGLGRQEDQLSAGRASLLDQQRALHGAALGAISKLPDPTAAVDPNTGIVGDVPPEAISKRRALGLSLSAMPDPQLSGLGTTLTKEADTIQAASEKRALGRSLGMVDMGDGRLVPKSWAENMLRANTKVLTDHPYGLTGNDLTGWKVIDKRTGKIVNGATPMLDANGRLLSKESPTAIMRMPDGSVVSIPKVPSPQATEVQAPGAPGTPLKAPPMPSSADMAKVTPYDDAADRVDRLIQAFKSAPGTYPGASTIHDLANLVGAQDPNYDVLRSLATSHLFKELKTNVGGRITNFELKYGKEMFPSADMRPESAIPMLQNLKSRIVSDKANAVQAISAQGKTTKNIPGTPGATPTRKVVRTGTRNGKKVVQYDDGTIEEAP